MTILLAVIVVAFVFTIGAALVSQKKKGDSGLRLLRGGPVS